MSVGCALCGAKGTEIVSRTDRHGQPLVTVLCSGCGVLRNDPVPTAEDLDRFYRKDYRESYKGATEPRLRQVWRNLERLKVHFVEFRDIYSRGGDWLDLGSGSGEFTFLAKHLGAEMTAVEPHEGYAAYCREKLGLDVAGRTLEECDFPAERFDLIRLSHVLEHMRDPVASLATLRGWLRPGGVIYIEVPNIEAEARNKLQGRMFHFGHIYNYNPVTLRHVAARAGLVELPETAGRCAGRCVGFFAAGEGGLLPDPVLIANADRMREAMRAHNARRLPEPEGGTAAGRFFRTMGARLREALAGQRMKTHRAIADAAAADLERTLKQVMGRA